MSLYLVNVPESPLPIGSADNQDQTSGRFLLTVPAFLLSGSRRRQHWGEVQEWRGRLIDAALADGVPAEVITKYIESRMKDLDT